MAETEGSITECINRLSAALKSDEAMQKRYVENKAGFLQEFGFPDEFQEALDEVPDHDTKDAEIADGMLGASGPSVKVSNYDSVIPGLKGGMRIKLNHAAVKLLTESEEEDWIEFAAGHIRGLGDLIFVERKMAQYADKGKGVHYNIDALNMATCSGTPGSS